MTNIGMTCLEELADFNEVIGEPANAKKAKKTSPKKITESKNKTENVKGQETKGQAPSKTKSQDKPEEPQTAPDNSGNGGNVSDNESKPTMSEAQKRAIYNLSRRRGISVEELETMSNEMYGVPLEVLNSSDASAFIRHLQQAA